MTALFQRAPREPLAPALVALMILGSSAQAQSDSKAETSVPISPASMPQETPSRTQSYDSCRRCRPGRVTTPCRKSSEPCCAEAGSKTGIQPAAWS